MTNTTSFERPHRKVRSFVLRPGRLTKAQARALQSLGPRYCLDPEQPVPAFDALFGRRAPRVLEIGFGNGEALLAIAGRHPETDFLGVEVHEPGIGQLLLGIEQLRLSNVRVLRIDAVEAVDRSLPLETFDVVNVFFPDPWPKRRHHKRRLIQAPLVAGLARLQPAGGLLHLATDWAPYATQMREVLAASPRYRVEPAATARQDPLAWRPDTRFERRGQRRGHPITDLYFRRCGR